MKTSLEELIEHIDNAIDNNNMVGSIIYPDVNSALLDIKRKAELLLYSEKTQIEKAIADGYSGCCGKKTTVNLKGNFWERKENWDDLKTAKETIVASTNKPELKVKCLHCGRKFIAQLHHKCNTGFRKRNHKWEDI